MRHLTNFTCGFLLVGIIAGCGLSSDIVILTSDLVKGTRLTHITIIPGNLTLSVGQEQIYTALGVFNNGKTRDQSHKVTWASGNTSVATFFKLDGKETLLAVSPGTATITASAGSISSTASLIVTVAALKSLQVNSTRSTIEVGQRQPFTATGKLANGMSEDLTAGVVWSSENTAVAIVNDAGFVTALTPGTVNITVSAGEIRGAAKLTVPAPTLTDIEITSPALSVAAGRTVSFTATGSFSNDTTRIITKIINWNSSDASVVTISKDGLANAVAKNLKRPQEVMISALSGKIGKKVQLTVTPPELTEIRVSPAIPFIAAGRTVIFSAEGMLTDGATVTPTSHVTWGSSAPSVVTIAKDGLATVMTPGRPPLPPVLKNKQARPT
jgi:uncharacterized protein YjdB